MALRARRRARRVAAEAAVAQPADFQPSLAGARIPVGGGGAAARAGADWRARVGDAALLALAAASATFVAANLATDARRWLGAPGGLARWER
eukprot:Transcript_24262.p4 GENE.Transcript_24262~~Transcript_24262.p4  ORF type:complete len:92 (-),score=27.90 Transcript_24262:110-385(-)